jgi:acyl-CoA thioesterase
MTKDALDRTMGLVRVIELLAEGRALIEYAAKPEQCHSGGVVQGGFITGWIDAAMAHAAIARSGPDVTPMSLEIKISFLAPVRPGPVFAEGWAVKHGRKTCFYEGTLKDSEGNVLAKASSTMMLADRSRVEAAAKAALDPG